MMRTLLIVMLLLAPGAVRAEVFHSRESALRLAFAGADSVEQRDVFLSEDQVERAAHAARSTIPSRLLTVYVGWRGGEITGYALIETHRVRTLPETLMMVLDAGGRVDGVHVLAFHEPPEYGAPPAWLRQFDGRELNDRLSPRGDIAGITGATITTQSVTAAVRRTLALFEVAIAPVSPVANTDRAVAGGGH
jgi:hypothetical protein